MGQRSRIPGRQIRHFCHVGDKDRTYDVALTELTSSRRFADLTRRTAAPGGIRATRTRIEWRGASYEFRTIRPEWTSTPPRVALYVSYSVCESGQCR